MHYSAPGGSLGTTIARMMGHDPADAAQMDLDRLKHLLEDEDGAGHFEGRSHKLARV
jgi:uncharacterized membrane protein